MKMINTLITAIFITFGLGSLPEMNPMEGGMIVIGLSEQKPEKIPTISRDGIVLFSFEL